MKLSIIERITLSGILPAEGDLVTIRILKGLKENLGFTEDEVKKFSVQVSGNQVTWQNGEEVDIEVGEVAVGIIKSALKKLDEEKKLSQDMLSLCDKFM